MTEKLIEELAKSVNRLAATDPNGPTVEDRVKEVVAGVQQLKTALEAVPPAPAPAPPAEPAAPPAGVIDQIDAMRAAAAAPAEKYGRIVSILDGLRHAVLLASRPQNAAVRPRVASIVQKMAGIFSEIDTVQDLNKPLEQIEAAVHSLYNGGKMNSPKTYMFEQRGAGHRTQKDQ